MRRTLDGARHAWRVSVLVCAGALLAGPLVAQTRPGLPADQVQRRGADPGVGKDPHVVDALRLLEVWLDSQLEYHDIPGISAAVVHDQELVWSHGLGYADVDRRTPATPQTVYSICSISKLFTAVGLMQQRDLGRLRLDDPVDEHLDWFDIRRKHPDGPPVRLEGLLTHSSGLPRESDFPYWDAPDFAFPPREQVMRRLAEQETLYPAERYFQYSNLGFTLAGEILSAVSGRPFDEYIRTHILDPVGMKETWTDIPGTERGGRLATGYGRRMQGAHRDVVPFYKVNAIAPAAGFASTVEDLARFASWQFRLLQRGGEEVLNANTLREMQRVHWVDPDWNTTWGLGFVVSRDGDKTFVGHGGSCPGYRSDLLLDPRESIATIMMANASGVDVGHLARQAYRIVSPAIVRAAADTGTAATSALQTGSEARPAGTADPALAKYLGVYRGFWGDAAIVRWEGGLAMVSLPTNNPVESLSPLRQAGEHTFRRVRKDSGELGEPIVFTIGPDGRAARMSQHSIFLSRVR